MGRGSARTALSFILLVGLLLVTAAAAQGAVRNVSNFTELRNAAFSLSPGDEVVIAPGVYHVTTGLYITVPNVTFRGATGNRDDVVLHGNGMNVNSGVLEGFWTAANGITVQDLTIRDFWHHGIHITGTDNITIRNVKTVNCGERHIKGGASTVSDNVLIENVWMEQTEEYLPRPGHSVDENDYIGGIDCMRVNNWTIRNCTALNIRGATGGGRAGIFLWNGVSNVVIEGCRIIRCGHGISIGNPSGPNSSHVAPWHAAGGVIRNNILIRRNTPYNWVLELDNVKDFRVYHNTIYSDDAGYFRTLQIYDEPTEGLTTNLDIRNNLIRGGVLDLSSGDWSGATVAAMGNIVGSAVSAAWFVDPVGNDLHLKPTATAAINQATPLVDVTFDVDGQRRGLLADMGADEYVLPGDVDGDDEVSVLDIVAVVTRFGTTPGSASWDLMCDMDGDGEISVLDITAVVTCFGDSM